MACRSRLYIARLQSLTNVRKSTQLPSLALGSELVGCDVARDNDAGGGGHTQLDHSSEAHIASDDDVLVPVRIDEDAT